MCAAHFVFCTQNLELTKAGQASIVNIASISGIVKNSQNGQFNYNSSKAATNQLTALMATEFSRKSIGIRVNAICPGCECPASSL